MKKKLSKPTFKNHERSGPYRSFQNASAKNQIGNTQCAEMLTPEEIGQEMGGN